MRVVLVGLSFICFVLVSIAGASRSAESNSAHDSISGESFKIIQAAMADFERAGLSIAYYRVTVDNTDAMSIVTFVDVDASVDQQGHVRGNSGKRPSFVVELRRNDLQIVRSNFVR